MKDSYIEGVARRRVDMLRPGDRIDLEGDKFVDPNETEFAYEFVTVIKITRETRNCYRVETSQGVFGFPATHWMVVDAEQVLPGLSRRMPRTNQKSKSPISSKSRK